MELVLMKNVRGQKEEERDVFVGILIVSKKEKKEKGDRSNF